jgi:hypothetical protein
MKRFRIFGERAVDPPVDILTEAKLQRITDFSPDDIFVAGYPKSGNTWMQYLIAGLIFGIDARFAQDSLIQDLVPDVYYKRFYRRYLTPTCFKTHDLPQPKFRKVIYIFRDGRDVMVSLFHYLKAIGTYTEYSELVTTGKNLFPCRWHEHIESWLSNPYGAEMVTISYENLQRNTVGELQKICEFAGLEREQPVLEMLARQTTFEMMRAREEKLGVDNPLWPKDTLTVRRGKIGCFQDEMPKQPLEAFMKMSMPTLERLGYL